MDRTVQVIMPKRRYPPLCPERVRQIPQQFSWIDQRFVRQHYIELCDHTTLALYLFLVTVSDAAGLSYYSDDTLCERLNLDQAGLKHARYWLQHLDLIAYKKPLYQVLPLLDLEALDD